MEENEVLKSFRLARRERRRAPEWVTKKKQLDLVKRFVLIVLMGKQTSEEEEDGTEMEEKLGEDVSLSPEKENYDSISCLKRKDKKKKKKKKDKWALLEMKQRHVVVVLHPGKDTDA